MSASDTCTEHCVTEYESNPVNKAHCRTYYMKKGEQWGLEGVPLDSGHSPCCSIYQNADSDCQEHLQFGQAHSYDNLRAIIPGYMHSANGEWAQNLYCNLGVMTAGNQGNASYSLCEDNYDEEIEHMDCADEISAGTYGGDVKEVEVLKQKTKSLKRKLRKWRKVARTALCEVCPSTNAVDLQTDMTPGVMKSVVQRYRQLKRLSEQQDSLIHSLVTQNESFRFEMSSRDDLIKELLHNSNGIRVAFRADSVMENHEDMEVNDREVSILNRRFIKENVAVCPDLSGDLERTGIEFGTVNKIFESESESFVSPTSAREPANECTLMDDNQFVIAEPSDQNSEVDRFSIKIKDYTMERNFTIHRCSRRLWWGVAVGVISGIVIGNCKHKK